MTASLATESWTNTRTADRICPLCEAMCGLRLTLKGDEVVDVRGNPDDLFSKGYLCPKGANLGALDQDPDRLSGPMVRRDGTLAPATWDEAFAAVKSGIQRTHHLHGRGSIAVYKGNPSAHAIAAVPYLKQIIKALGGDVYSASTADQMPTQMAMAAILGNAEAIPVPDIDRTNHILILGANPVESNGSLIGAPDFPGRLRGIRERGGTVTVVDPRRTRTAKMANRYLSIRPGTDAYLLLGVLHVLFDENLTDLGPLRYRVSGVAELEGWARRFDPKRVSAACDVPAAEVQETAREFAAARTAVVYGRMGTCTARHGTVTNVLIQAINVLTGNFDREGGVLFPVNPVRPAYRPDRPFAESSRRSRVRRLQEVLGEFPIATLADEIETPGPGQINGLVTYAGNPVLSSPNGDRLGRVLPGLEFMLSIDPYVNETTRHADVILPPPRILQAGHFDWILNGAAVRTVPRYSPPVVALPEGCPSDEDILIRVASIAAGREECDPAAERAALTRSMLSKAASTPGSPVADRDPSEMHDMLVGTSDVQRHLDAMLRLGAFGDMFGSRPDGLTLQLLIDHPEGVDFGPMRPRLDAMLLHPDGRIVICPDNVVPELQVLQDELDGEQPRFVLIGRRKLRSNNSWMHNLPNLVSGPEGCTAMLSIADADELGVTDGELIRIISAVGEVVAPVETTSDLRKGVVSLPHGWGHSPSRTGQTIAATVAGVSANALTDHTVIDALSGNAVFNGVPVRLEPVSASAT